MDESTIISVETEIDEKDLADFHDLLGQLSANAPHPDFEQVKRMFEQPGFHLVVARTSASEEGDGGEGVPVSSGARLSGMLSLVVFDIPSGRRARIEDVVVHRDRRGRGLARGMSMHAISLAGKLGARSLDLTSSPSRKAANALYRSLGFDLRETNLYRLSPGSVPDPE